MNIKKKILMIAVGPVLMLGVISIFFHQYPGTKSGDK